MSSFVREYSTGLTVSLAGHGLLFLLFGLNIVLMPAPAPQPVRLAIEATVIDTGVIRQRQEEEQRRVRALEQQRQQAEAAQRKKQEAEQRKEEQARVTAERKAEQTRIAEQRKAEEAKRKREEAQSRKAEQERVAEQKRQQDAERKRREAEQKRRQAELQADLQRDLAAEEQRQAAVDSGKLAQYLALIRNRVERNWVPPASAKPGVECVVHVTQIPGGDIVNVRMGRCNADAVVIRSIEAAVFRASPLPPPTDPSLFDRNLRFTFKPEQ